MKQHLLFVLVALLCCWTSDVNASTITQDEALQVVKNNRTAEGLSNTDVNFYITEVDTIVNNFRCPVDMSTVTEQWLVDNSPKWLVFVDEEPRECWGHHCSYYYLPQNVDALYPLHALCFNGILPPIQSTQMTCVESHYEKPNYVFTDINVVPDLYGNNNLLDGIELPPNSNKIGVLLIGSSSDDADLPRSNGDFSLLYQMFTKKLGVPPRNIMMFLGNSDNYDTEDQASNRYHIEKDLDNNGIDEILYPLSWWEEAFRWFNTAYQNAGFDHIFVFVGTRAYDVTVGLDNLRLSNSMRLDNAVEGLPSRAKTVLMCGENLGSGNIYNTVYMEAPDNYALGMSYTPFVHHFVSGVIGHDITSGDSINVDSITDGIISMAELFNYADSKTEDCNATIDSRAPGLADILTFDFTPSLYSNVTVRQMNGLSEVNWDSPDIWIRNQDDGLEHQYSECITVSSSGSNTKYIYAKVRNLGLALYEYLDSYIRFDWSSNDILCNNNDYSSVIGRVNLDEELSSGDSRIVKMEWNMPENLVSSSLLNGGVASISLYAKFGSDFDEPRTVIRKQLTVYDISKGTIQTNPNAVSSRHGIEVPISIGGMSQNVLGDSYSIEVIPGKNTSSLLRQNAKLSLEMSTPLYRAWQTGGSVASGVNVDVANNKKFNFTTAGCSFNNIPSIYSNVSMVLSVFSSRTTYHDDEESDLYILIRNEQGKIIDGHTLKLFADGSNTGNTGNNDGSGSGEINPGIGVGINGENIVLSAQNVNVPVTYSWKKLDENIQMGNSEILEVNSDDNNKTIVLNVISNEDGNTGSAFVDLSNYNFLTEIVQTAQGFSVKFLKPASGNTQIMLSSINGDVTRVFNVPEGETSFNVPVVTQGIYVLYFTTNGTLTSQRRLIY